MNTYPGVFNFNTYGSLIAQHMGPFISDSIVNDELATNSYSVVVKNLITDVISTYNANTNQTTITLNKAEPYSWYIVSKSNATTQTAQSPTWKFYLAGDAEIHYAPFPATINFPTPGSTITGTSTKLEWTGSDVDNDIVSYQVYLDITNASTLLSTTTNSTIENVAIQNGNTYYWKVITTDSQGNTSSSGVFTFKVN